MSTNLDGSELSLRRCLAAVGRGVSGLAAAACGVAALTAMPAMAQSAPPPGLSEVQAVAVAPTGAKGVLSEEQNLRRKAMQEAAQSYGARAGLLRRSYDIRRSLDGAAQYLDAIWNFTPLMLIDRQPDEEKSLRARNIIPPVIVRAEQTFKQDGPNLIRIVDRTYRIEAQARFTSTPPLWRQYLFRDLGESVATPPHASLMPRNDDEKAQWQRWVAQGWEAGIKQGDTYFEIDLNRLARDYNGMVLYHELLLNKMVSLPYVATVNNGVTGDDTTLNINDVQLRITVMPAFSHDTSKWVPNAVKTGPAKPATPKATR